jgi:hypothetical protein
MAPPTPAASRRIPQTFECRPTIAGAPPNALPDELMIDWGGLPAGTQASIYLPAVSSGAILTVAGRLYNGRPLTALDGHTIRCDASGLTYVPIPVGSVPGPGYAGLLTIMLPPSIAVGWSYRVTVRQLTTVAVGDRERGSPGIRKALGAFQLNVSIQSAASLLKPDQRNLALFRWILGTLQDSNRWIPVLQRYIGELANRIDTSGGISSLIAPSQVGAIPDDRGPHRASEQLEAIGKIERLIFDRFGDFESFVLETDSGERRQFFSREPHLAELARFVWQARIRVTVFAKEHEPHVPDRIALHAPVGQRAEWHDRGDGARWIR